MTELDPSAGAALECAADSVRTLTAFDREQLPNGAHLDALTRTQSLLVAVMAEVADDAASESVWQVLVPLVHQFTEHRDVFVVEPIATLMLLNMTGNYLYATGQFLPALALLQRGSAIADRTVGRSHEWWVTSWLNMARAAIDADAVDEAVSAASAVVAVIEAGAEIDHEATVRAYQICGDAFGQQSDWAGAHRMHARALALLTQRNGPNNLWVYDAHAEVAETQVQLGYLADARLHAQHALAGWEAALGPWHEKVGARHGAAGRIAHMQGDLPAAWHHLAHALQVAQLQSPINNKAVVVHGTFLSQVLTALGDLRRLAAVHECVITAVEAEVGPCHPRVAQLRCHLGNVQSRLGNHAAAALQFECALAITDLDQNTSPNEIAQLRAKLDASRVAFAGARRG